MSVPNKSLDKNKRFAGVKANDFVNKTRANEVNRSGARPQGWANLGKINSRRVPPPANVPSLKSETGSNTPAFDPTVVSNHGWSSNDNTGTINSPSNPTQQQLDSLLVNSPTPPSSADIDKTRVPPTWSTVTAVGTNVNPNEPPPSLLALNDFPRLATSKEDRKFQSESMTNMPNPTFRPANLATWKEGGGIRVQSSSNDLSPLIPTNPGANFYQPPNMRMCPPEMWNYNPYPPAPLPIHHQHHHQQQRRVNSMNDYRSPTILRNKDIDDLSKITDNTWANASQEVNYDEKIRFSDDEETLNNNHQSHRMNHSTSKHVRLIHDDDHVKQMQDNKNSELINVLNIAKQRRDEQERHLRNEKLNNHSDESKPTPGYQTRPLLTSNDQENYPSPSSPVWQTNKDTSRTPNSQSSFAMKSWSDQMDSFNYSSMHETTHPENEDPSIDNQYSRSQSESSSQSQLLAKKTRRPILIAKKPVKSNINPNKKTVQVNEDEYYDNSNDQWINWNDLNENQSRQQFPSDELSTSKSPRNNKPTSVKIREHDRVQVNNRTKPMRIQQIIENKSTNNKPSSARQPQSPPIQLMKAIESPAQESISYKPQQQRAKTSDHNKQRYQTNTINTASIPPLMSVRSDATTTANLYQTMPSDYYEDDNTYYNSNLQSHQRYHPSNVHNRGYTTLGSYGRYRRGGTVRHQQQQQQQQHQYSTYNPTRTPGVSSAPTTTTGARQKKNSTNKKSHTSSEQNKTTEIDEVHSPVVKTPSIIEETKFSETPVPSPTIDMDKSNGTSESKSAIKPDALLTSSENDSAKPMDKTLPSTSTNSKQRTNKNSHDQRYSNQQASSRHRNDYPRAKPDYDSTQATATHTYYGNNNRRTNRMHDLSSGYYYDQTSTHYHNRYNYSTGHYGMNSQSRSKRGVGSSNNHHRQAKQVTINGTNNNNNNTNFRHHSTSDNDQKEGEEWETASESSTNMRNGHDDTNPTSKSLHRGRTPPKKSFSSQRPNPRQFFKYTNA